MSQLKPQLQPTTLSESEIHDAMVELHQGGEKGIVSDGVHDRQEEGIRLKTLLIKKLNHALFGFLLFFLFALFFQRFFWFFLFWFLSISSFGHEVLTLF